MLTFPNAVLITITDIFDSAYNSIQIRYILPPDRVTGLRGYGMFNAGLACAYSSGTRVH